MKVRVSYGCGRMVHKLESMKVAKEKNVMLNVIV